MTETKGHCLCGAVHFSFTGQPNWVGHCHCESCRRATSSPFTTFLGVPRSAVRFTGATAGTYESSPGVRRLFCRFCGSPIAYDAEAYPEEMHFFVASLENPEDFPPESHGFAGEQLSWIHLNDDLPRYLGAGEADEEKAEG